MYEVVIISSLTRIEKFFGNKKGIVFNQKNVVVFVSDNDILTVFVTLYFL